MHDVATFSSVQSVVVTTSSIPGRQAKMSETEEEDAIGGTCECEEEVEILVGSEGTSHKNGNGSSAPGDDNSYLPILSNDIALLILARLPRSKYCDLRLVNQQFCSLIRSGELNGTRKKLGIKEPKVFLLSKKFHYWCYEPYTRSCWDLPVCPYDETIAYCGKITFCVGTHLLVLSIIGDDINIWRDPDIWRYELELNQWFNGPMMTTPRYFFAFADCGNVACVAGGYQQASEGVLNSAEKYNPESKSWEPLPSMNRRRTFCLGFYMDSKFYVISGRNENYKFLFCGECYDFELNVWELIPNMIEDDMAFGISERLNFLADLMAVVNNELYYLEFPSRHLKVYLKNNNTWKKVGSAPSSIDENSGVALKSLGNELLLFGKTLRNHSTQEIDVCFCTPSPELDDVEWHVLDFNNRERNPLIYNCCVMMV